MLDTNVSYFESWTPVGEDYEPVEVFIENAARLNDIVEPGSEFEVSSPYFWADCPDNCEPALWYYDITTQTCKEIPESLVKPSNIII